LLLTWVRRRLRDKKPHHIDGAAPSPGINRSLPLSLPAIGYMDAYIAAVI
jgi:hypothetical protein